MNKGRLKHGKLIDLECPDCGATDSRLETESMRCACGAEMKPLPWMNNKLPTCGVK